MFRTRFAPSPTGQLHIGGARTALYSDCLTRVQGGKLVLRIEDTDHARNKEEYVDQLRADLQWLGIQFDEAPGHGDLGPYRQSQRTELYQEYADKLLESGHAYFSFMSKEEIEQENELSKTEGRQPCYHQCSLEEAKKRIAGGEKAAVRFRVPSTSFSFVDKVRGLIEFPPQMIPDFMLIREDGSPLYNFCCVVDDALMNINYVLRADDHINNTLKQLMVYEALHLPVPEFAHVSLLVGLDHKKLSKRHGATGLGHFREKGFLPEAVANYLILLGASHPEQLELFDVLNTTELKKWFSDERFSKSPAVFDEVKLRWMNGQYLKKLGATPFKKQLLDFMGTKAESLYPGLSSRSNSWWQVFFDMVVEKIQTLDEAHEYLKMLWEDSSDAQDSELEEILQWESTETLRSLTTQWLEHKKGVDFLTQEQVQELMKEAKGAGVKGKFLFKGIRVLLTGMSQGPDLKSLVCLTPVERLQARIQRKAL